MIFCTTQRSYRQAGFTLVELLLVLALLVVLATVATVTLTGVLGSANLSQSGETVRIAMTKAKLQAVERGEAMLFRAQIGTGDFRIESASAALTEVIQSQGSTPAGQQVAVAAIEPITGKLEENIVFREVNCTTIDGGALPETVGAGAEGAWSTPIVFMPSGMAYNADVLLARMDESENAVRWLKVSLRGLTCTTKAEQVDEDTLGGSSVATPLGSK